MAVGAHSQKPQLCCLRKRCLIKLGRISCVRFFFPKEFREFPYRRLIFTTLRTLHIICFSILVGGFFFHQDKSQLSIWFLGAMLSGLGMFLLDLYGSCIALFEVRGISVLIKLVLLALVPAMGSSGQIIILIMVIILSSYVSHTSRRIRHKSFMSRSFLEKYGIQMNKKFK